MRSERHLHRAAVLVGALAAARDALLPIAVGFLVSGGGSGQAVAYAVVGVVASAVAGFLRWSQTRYWVADQALHLRSGVFSPDERVVPLTRVTALDEVRGPVQRLFGVVALHVQTAGGGAQGEIVLSAIGRAAADELREIVRAEEAVSSAETAPAADAEWRLGFGALLITALTGPQLGVVLPLAAGGAALAFQSLGEEDGRAVVRRLPGDAAGWEQLAALVALAVLVLALAGAVIGFGGFAAERSGRRLRLRRGYVQRRLASLDLDRVHAVRVVEGVLRRPLGLCSIRLEVAGYAREPAVARTLVPLCRRRDAGAILERLVPALPLPEDAPERPPQRALRRFVVPPLAIGVLLSVGILVASAPTSLTAVPVLLGLASGVLDFRAAGWWLGDTTVAVRSQRLLVRTSTIALTRRLQDAVLAESLGERRSGLATVELAVASKHRAHVRHIALGEATALFGRLRALAIGS